jgi:hypothetical protein
MRKRSKVSLKKALIKLLAERKLNACFQLSLSALKTYSNLTD